MGEATYRIHDLASGVNRDVATRVVATITIDKVKRQVLRRTASVTPGNVCGDSVGACTIEGLDGTGAETECSIITGFDFAFFETTATSER